jgi:hypothetical protein
LLLLAGCGSNSDPEAYLEHCNPAPATPRARELPPRSERLAAKAVAAVRSDPTVQELIGGREFTSPRQIPWQSGDSENASGYVVTMKFEEPFSVESEEWPVLIGPGAGRPNANETPRLLCKQGVEATDVTVLSATVNLQSMKVEDLKFYDSADPSFDGGAQVNYHDIGPLPEKYRPVPGY